MEAAWDARASLACLSVRSGFDALLGALALPRGSEVLMSAVNIADMARIIEAHGLTPVPVDLDMQTLTVSMASLARAATPCTRAVLVAHLFGSRMPMPMPMPALVEFTHKNKYLLNRRLLQGEQAGSVRRIANARKLQALLSGARCIGAQAVPHRHWMFPLVHEQGDALIGHLAARGFDATHKASSIGLLAAPPGCAPAAEATRAFSRLIYLPAHEGMSGADIERLADAMAEFERQHPAQGAGALKVP